MLKRHADRMWGPSYVKHRFQKGMLERMEEWYIQRDNAWIFSKIDERHESRYKYTHTLSWILMNTHFFFKEKLSLSWDLFGYNLYQENKSVWDGM